MRAGEKKEWSEVSMSSKEHTNLPQTPMEKGLGEKNINHLELLQQKQCILTHFLEQTEHLEKILKLLRILFMIDPEFQNI